MMEILNQFTPTMIAIALCATGLVALVSLALAGLSYYHFRRVFNLHHEQIIIVREDLGAICNGSLGLGERLAKMESRLNVLAKRQEHLELHEAPERSYKQAIRLVRQGANVEELMTDCGLARGEAELVLLSKQLDRSM